MVENPGGPESYDFDHGLSWKPWFLYFPLCFYNYFILCLYIFILLYMFPSVLIEIYGNVEIPQENHKIHDWSLAKRSSSRGLSGLRSREVESSANVHCCSTWKSYGSSRSPKLSVCALNVNGQLLPCFQVE